LKLAAVPALRVIPLSRRFRSCRQSAASGCARPSIERRTACLRLPSAPQVHPGAIDNGKRDGTVGFDAAARSMNYSEKHAVNISSLDKGLGNQLVGMADSK
jgi:hypothetical protein